MRPHRSRTPLPCRSIRATHGLTADRSRSERPATTPDSVTTNISGSGFDLAVSGITDIPDPANREAQLAYTIIAENNGTAPTPPTDKAIVRVAMPTGAVGVSIVGAAGTNGFNCGVTTPTSFPFDCKGDLPAGGDTTITVTLNVLLGAPDDLVLTATIDPDADFAESDEGNNTQIEATTVSGDTCTVSPCIDLVARPDLRDPGRSDRRGSERDVHVRRREHRRYADIG